MNVKMHFDTSGITKAIEQLRPLVKKTKEQMVREAAKSFVVTMLEITPPASKGKTGSKAKAQGQQTIVSDLAKIMVAVRKKSEMDTRATTASPEELHRRFRDARTGRVNRRALAHPYKVKSTELNALKAKLWARVGWLAAGWNKAAGKLGLSGRQWPSWIARHGSGKGFCNITQSSGRFRIEVANTVPYAVNVKDLDRRIEAAIKYTEFALLRQVEPMLKKALAKAGFKH